MEEAEGRLRHELKHWITPADKAEIIARMRVVASADPHYRDRPYHIRSLYFDDPYDTALIEKLDGLPYHEKFRIRYYDGDAGYNQSR